ncbi:MAG TPA: tetratricopeptide repeat protein, partial [Anaerolineales bacterium]|nr:tetratricopeptide repeat protein [Anaerolineales bacterium]
GNISAEGMHVTTLTETADCLRDLGRLDEAASIYQGAIRRNEELGRERSVAVSKGQLGTVRLRQNRFDEALTAYKEALTIFESLGEPVTVAVAWHQIGRVHSETGRLDLAEEAYRQSLAIEVKTKNLEGEATSLGELGNLYSAWGRLEEAVTFKRQAADAYNRLHNLSREGLSRSNLAITLIELRRYDEARREVLQAIECKALLGQAAQIWKTWNALCDLEKATGNYIAADAARQKGIESYLAYRRAGGVSQHNRFDLFALVTNALQENQAEVALQQLAQISAEDIPQWLRSLIAKLQAILQGDRSPSLADDPSFSYTTVVELQLLLDQNPLPNA